MLYEVTSNVHFGYIEMLDNLTLPLPGFVFNPALPIRHKLVVRFFVRLQGALTVRRKLS